MTLAITVTSGPKNATTDPESGLRYYTWQGKQYPSVSSLRKMAGLSFMLHQWALSRVIERAVTQRDVLNAMLDRPKRPRERVRDKNVVLEASRWLRSAATEERDAAAELGTAVHTAALMGADEGDVDADVAPYLRHFQHWLAVSKARVLAVEKQCWNLTAGYAGSFDFLVEFPNGDIYVIDIKSSRGTYTDHALQLIGYKRAEFVGEDDVIDQHLTWQLSRAKGMALLHLTPDGWKFQRIKPLDRMFQAFEGLLVFATFMADNQTIDGLVMASKEGSAP